MANEYETDIILKLSYVLYDRRFYDPQNKSKFKSYNIDLKSMSVIQLMSLIKKVVI